MELVLMLPINKPPFIGILYPDPLVALSDCRYLLSLKPDMPLSLKIETDYWGSTLTFFVDYKQHYKHMKLKTDEFELVKKYRKFENADIVNFGPVINKNGKRLPLRSPTDKKWLTVPLTITAFYFRQHL